MKRKNRKFVDKFSSCPHNCKKVIFTSLIGRERLRIYKDEKSACVTTLFFHCQICKFETFLSTWLLYLLLCTYHLLLRRSTHGNQVGMVQFWYFFLPRGGGEFSFGNDFAGPRGHTHGICSRQCDGGEKCLNWYHGQCVKISKKRAKKSDTFVCYFCQ